MNDETTVYGVILPIQKRLVPRVLEYGRNVIVKYYPHRSSNTRIGKDTRVVVYESEGCKNLVGEGIVRSIGFMLPQLALRRFGNHLFLSAKEFDEYSKRFPGREDKPVMVLELESIRRYEHPIKSPHKVSMAGIYIDRNEYEDLIKKSN